MAQLPVRRVDLVIGSDVTYFDDDFAPLLATLAALDAHESVLAVQNRNGCHESFAREARRRGWAVEHATCRVFDLEPTRGHERRYSCDRVSVLRLIDRGDRLVVKGVAPDGRSTRWAFRS